MSGLPRSGMNGNSIATNNYRAACVCKLVGLIFAGLALFAWLAVLVARPIVAINGTVEGPVVVTDALFCYCMLRWQPLHQATPALRRFWAFPGLLRCPSEDLWFLPRGAHSLSMQRMILSRELCL